MRHFESTGTILDKTKHFNTRSHTVKPNDGDLGTVIPKARNSRYHGALLTV